MTALTIFAPAKLNLALAVSPEIIGGKHLLQSVFTTIDLTDELVFEYQQDRSTALRIRMDFAPELPQIVIAQPKNIIYQALRAFESRFDCKLTGALSIRVKKNIPTQAGLGGGSSDAAATLLAAQQLSGIKPKQAELASIAAELGADVAFFLEGGCALMGGHGETMIEKLYLPQLDIVLVKPNQGLSTARVYQQFSKSPQLASGLTSMVKLLKTPQQDKQATTVNLVRLLSNNLTDAAETLAPEIIQISEALEQQPGIIKAMLTGSGSTVFAIADNSRAAQAAALHFETLGFWAKACKTTSDS